MGNYKKTFGLSRIFKVAATFCVATAILGNGNGLAVNDTLPDSHMIDEALANLRTSSKPYYHVHDDAEYPVYTKFEDYGIRLPSILLPDETLENVVLNSRSGYADKHLVDPSFSSDSLQQIGLRDTVISTKYPNTPVFSRPAGPSAVRSLKMINMNGMKAINHTIIDLSRTKLYDVQVNYSQLTNLRLNNTDIDYSGFSYAILPGLYAPYMTASQSGFKGSQLSFFNFEKAFIHDCGFEDSVMALGYAPYAIFDNVDVRGTTLNGTDASYSQWRNFNLDGAFALPVLRTENNGTETLYPMKLHKAILQDGSARNTDLRGADLSYSQWVRVDMMGMDWRYADLKGIKPEHIEDCEVKGLNIYGAKNISSALRKKLLGMGAISQEIEHNPVKPPPNFKEFNVSVNIAKL